MADQHFRVGAKVEVSSDDEGFLGAWYGGTVTESPKRGKCVVRYDALTKDEEGLIPLTESVKIEFVRPLPPPNESGGCCATVGDLVDALYRDGWWIGVVGRVDEGGERILVRFENHTDDIEFVREKIRLHLDWIDGNWVKPKPNKSATGMGFAKGASVEVSLQRKNGVHNVWYFGTVLDVIGNDNFLIEYQCAGVDNKVEKRKVNVGSFYIRPSPPCLEGRIYKVEDKVDVFSELRWWSGVIREFLDDKRYVILINDTKEEKEFADSKLRPHVEWDGKWIVDPPVQGTNITQQVATPHDSLVTWNGKKRTASKSQGKKGISMEYSAAQIVEKECIAEELDMSSKAVRGTQAENASEIPLKGPLESMKDLKQQMVDPEIHIEVLPSTKSNQKKKRGRPRKLLPQKQIGDVGIESNSVSREVVVKDSVTDKVEANTGMDLVLMTNDDNPLSEPNVMLALRGVPPSENENATEEVFIKRVKRQNETVSNGVGERSTTMDIECRSQDCQDSSRGKTSEISKISPEITNHETLDDGLLADANNDQTLSMWIEGNHSQTITVDPVSGVGSIVYPDQTDKAIGRIDDNEILLSAIATGDSIESSKHRNTDTNCSDSGALFARNLSQSSGASDAGELGTPASTIVVSDSVDNVNHKLPFVKSSSFWSVIESMEIFQKSQKPHFCSLVNFNEHFDEGAAIGYMVTFSKMMDTAPKLRFSDPRETIEKTLETLAHLKLNGFDVGAVEARLVELLSKKIRLDELQLEYKEVECQIRNINLEEGKGKSEVDEIEWKMKALAEKLAEVRSMREMKQQEICELQSRSDAIRENMNSILHEYE